MNINSFNSQTSNNEMEPSQFTQELLYLANELSELKKVVEYIGKSQLKKVIDNWVDGDEVLKALKISKRTLQSYRDKGILGYTQFGNKLFYKVRDIQQLLDKNYKKY